MTRGKKKEEERIFIADAAQTGSGQGARQKILESAIGEAGRKHSVQPLNSQPWHTI